MTSFDKIGLWVTLLINKVKVVFAKTMRNSLIISHYQSHYVRILVGVPKNYRTERLLAERTAALFSFQYTDVWFLCKTNLSHFAPASKKLTCRGRAIMASDGYRSGNWLLKTTVISGVAKKS